MPHTDVSAGIAHSISRRAMLRATAATGCTLARPWDLLRASFGSEPVTNLRFQQWKRDPRNPIFPPSREGVDTKRCMNPFVIRRDDEYWMFYAGADAGGRHRICLAVAPVDKLTKWERRGPIFDLGGKGDFDELWCVLPCVHRIGNRWHLYYTGRSADISQGLQSFRGIGLAISDDLVHWEKRPSPVLQGDGFAQWPDNRGIAGGGSILELPQADGRILYRMYYTLATGRPDKDPRIDQQKQSVAADSYDGFEWFDKRVVLQPRADADYENCGTIALNVWRNAEGFHAIYGAIGTRFGAYSLCEAVSTHGLQWERGVPGQNLVLPPSGTGWDSKMTTYPNIVREGETLRLFYCGNGYGTTGIGTAISSGEGNAS